MRVTGGLRSTHVLGVIVTFKVTATPWEHGYVLDIEGYGSVTQSYGRDDAELMVRDWLEINDVPDAQAEAVEIHFRA